MESGKPTDGFRVLNFTSLEPVVADLGLDTTGLDRFFVCNAGSAPSVDADRWSVRVDGDGIDDPVSFGIDDLAQLEQVEVPAWLECAGNGRRLFELVDGHPASAVDADTPWLLGGMGMARWRGPRLAELVGSAGVTPDAAWVAPAGLDVDNPEGEPVRMCLPLAKALDRDTIVATHMNDAPLIAAHGAPARLIVPGWIGAYSVKWLDRVEVSSEWVPSWRADDYYRHRRPDGTDLGPVTAHPVKSSLALDWPGLVPAGVVRLWGYARSGHGRIGEVEWSLDGGAWHPADRMEVEGRWSWTPFTIEVDLAPGEHSIRSRATDETGATQPDSVPFNPAGIMWNAVTAHPVVAE